jgi:hypothetical protein
LRQCCPSAANCLADIDAATLAEVESFPERRAAENADVARGTRFARSSFVFAQLTRVLAVTALVALTPGCYAEADAEPVYVDTAMAPVEVEVAPTYYYEGRPVYYVHDHWYARDGARWMYYRTEPAPLARYRLNVQRAPRAPERERFSEPRRPEREERREAAPR